MPLSGIPLGRNLESFLFGIAELKHSEETWEALQTKQENKHQTKPKQTGKVEIFPSSLPVEKGRELWLWGTETVSHQWSHNAANSRWGSVWCWEAKCYRGHYSSEELNNAQEFSLLGSKGESHLLHCWKISTAHPLKEYGSKGRGCLCLWVLPLLPGVVQSSPNVSVIAWEEGGLFR